MKKVARMQTIASGRLHLTLSMALAAVFVLAAPSLASATEYYVASDGSDENPGTSDRPLATIQKAVTLLKPGDCCIIREGRYQQSVSIEGLHGTKENPIVLQSAPGERVVLDGTVPIDSQWQKYRGQIYKTTLDEDIWQLFLDDRKMIAARWPNASSDPKADNYIWDGRENQAWARQGDGSSFGRMVDPALAQTGIDLTGAMAVLNVGRFVTFARKVKNHQAGKDRFGYATDFDLFRFREDKRPEISPIMADHSFWRWPKTIREGRYFLEGKLELLDAPGEWFFDASDKALYVWCPDSKSPEGRDLRGKTTTYAIKADNCRHVILKGFEFFGSTFRFSDSAGCVVQDCRLKYFATSKRILGTEIEDRSQWAEAFCPTLMEGWGVYHREPTAPPNVIRNCTFDRCEGGAFAFLGNGLADNVRLRRIDWSGIGCVTVKTYRNTTLRRVEAAWCGASECLRVGENSLVELCLLGPKLGVMQEDGAAVQVFPHTDTVVRNNWTFGHTKFGYRTDGPGLTNTGDDRMKRATVLRNVCWGMTTTHHKEAIKIKGDAHHVYHNLAFDIENIDIGIPGLLQGSTHNTRTISRNNAAGEISSERNPSKADVPPAGIADHNFTGGVFAQLRDPGNRDFRPREESALVDAGAVLPGVTDKYVGAAPDIGAYEFGDETYWIPGFQTAAASKPIPADGAASVRPNTDPIWLEGYRAQSSDVYLGTNCDAVLAATRNSREYRGRQGTNIFDGPRLEPGRTYYWRVDAVGATSTVTGPVWSFTTEQDPPDRRTSKKEK